MIAMPVCAEDAPRAPMALERRAFPRLPSRVAALCRPGDQPFHLGVRATLVDVSQGGIGLRLAKPFEPGALIELELEPLAGARKLVRLAEVRWVQPLPDGSYRLGCCWEHRLTFAEVQLLT